METPFNQAIRTFLMGRCDEMLDGTEISAEFQTADQKVAELQNQLKPRLNEEGRQILLNLYMQQNYRMTEAAAAGYQKGFAEGIKFILYLALY